MPLVDYASSDGESDENENCEEKVPKEKSVSAITKTEPSSSKIVHTISSEDNSDSIFSELPKPKTNFSFLTDDNKLHNFLLNKKINFGQKSEKGVVRIGIPSMSDFKEQEDEPVAKKLKPSTKNSGLFSVLPPPKNVAPASTKKLIPDSVSKFQHIKNTNAAVKNKFLKGSLTAKKANQKNNNDDEDDDDDDTLVGNSFFGSSLSKQDEDIKTNSADSVYETIISSEGTSTTFEPSNNICDNNYVETLEENSNLTDSSLEQNNIVPVEDNLLGLDEKALQILCGNKKKRQQMPINVIDLSGEEIMPDSKEWLLKELGKEQRTRSHSHRKTHGPSSQQRRKHQITYLAFQAKEQELELQNQWANNRMSRRQTQSKYGF